MRTLLVFATVTLAAAFSGGCDSTALTSAPPTAATPTFELGVQAWTFNRGTFAEAVDKISALGVKYVQAYPRQKIGGGIEGTLVPTMDEATRVKLLALLRSKGVTLTSFGVVRAANEEEWRQIFHFARALSLRDIACEPPKASLPEVLPLLDRLSREYGVAVSLHNHPNPNNPPSDVVAALKPFGPSLGFCGDTGHWARSGFDPVECLRVAEGRLISLHFKDLTEIARAAHDVPWGTGASNAAGQVAELKRQHFRGIVYVEYEYKTPQLDAEVARCVEFFRRAQQASLDDLVAGRVVPPGYTDQPADLTRPGQGRDSARWPTADKTAPASNQP